MTNPPVFECDVMLGGLARWLRAAGYDAAWHKHIADPDLVRIAHRAGRMLLSSDTGIFRTGVVRDGDVSALFVPHGLSVTGQLEFVLRQLKLPVRAPRCMVCGGELTEISREQAFGRVPEGSWRAHERFWECSRCAQVFWRGTHWERIAQRLDSLQAGAGATASSSE